MIRRVLFGQAATRVALLAALMAATIAVQARFYLGAPFRNGMMMQQRAEVVIWGTASPGSTISITPSWDSPTVKTQAGADRKWSVKVSTPSASFEEQELEIADDQGWTSHLRNILIGEVWLASGQSNMEMPVSGWGSDNPIHHVDSILDSATRYAGKLRFVKVPAKLSGTPSDSCGIVWQECSSSTISSFSVVSYFFATHLIDSLNIPVGIINASFGGSDVIAWMPGEVCRSVSGIPINSSVYNNITQSSPAACYNTMIRPLRRFTIAGFIWYQGENNVYNRREDYARNLTDMIRSWREEWGQGDLPFYQVELTPYSYGNIHGTEAPLVREEQNLVTVTIPNVRMAGTNDLVVADETTRIHPRHKLGVGQRLGNWALHDVYGFDHLRPACPQVKQVRFASSKAYVSFTEADDGLTAEGEITGFELAGSDGQFYQAQAKIEGNEVAVTCSSVAAPAYVRYCYRNFLMGNLKNKVGLPILAFRTDNPLVTYLPNAEQNGRAELQTAINYAQFYQSRFAPGTQPGYVDESYYTQFTSTLAEAIAALNTRSDAATNTALTKRLNDLNNGLPRHVIPLTEGFYQIVSGLAAFKAQTGGEKGMTGQTDGNLKWSTLFDNNLFSVFELKKGEGDTWSIQCVGTQTYLSTYAGGKARIQLSEEPCVGQIIRPFYNGQWSIINEQLDEDYYANGHANGSGASGYIVGTPSAYGSAGSWYLRKITDENRINTYRQMALTTRLKKAADKSRQLLDSIQIGTSFGDVEADVHNRFETTINQAADAQGLTEEKVEQLIAELQQAEEAFLQSRLTFKTNVWYYIVNQCAAATTPTAVEPHHQALYLRSANTKEGEKWSSTADIAAWGYHDPAADTLTCRKNAYAMWRIVPIEGRPDAFALQNRATGTYLSSQLTDARFGSDYTPQPYSIQLLGRDQFSLSPLAIANGSSLAAIATDQAISTAKGGYATAAAWTFIEVTSNGEPETIGLEVTSGRVSIMCLPYAIESVSAPGHTVKTYTLKNIPSEETLQLSEKRSFAAGEPFFMLIGQPGSTPQPVMVEVTAPNDYVHEAQTVNGLVGVLDKTRVKGKGFLYFNSQNELKAAGSLSFYIEGHSGYVDPRLVSDAGGQADLTIGKNADGVVSVVRTDSERKVDVFTLDGRLVKKQVPSHEALQGLKKGIYIIGKEKVSVE